MTDQFLQRAADQLRSIADSLVDADRGEEATTPFAERISMNEAVVLAAKDERPPRDTKFDEPWRGTIRFVAGTPTSTTLVRFMSRAAVPGLRSRAISRDRFGSELVYLCEGYFDPSLPGSQPLDEPDTYRVESLYSGPDPNEMVAPVLRLHATEATADSVKVRDLNSSEGPTGSLRLRHMEAQPLDEHVWEVEILIEAVADCYLTNLHVESASGILFFWVDGPRGTARPSNALLYDGGRRFPWRRGAMGMFRLLVSPRRIDEGMAQRWAAWEHHVVFNGPGSLHRGGWGPLEAPLPLLEPEAVGWDVRLDRHQRSNSQAQQLEDGTHPEFKVPHPAPLGPWRPLGGFHGGATGGVGIHPFAAWGQTPGELRECWWRAKRLLERQHEDGVWAPAALPPKNVNPSYLETYLAWRPIDSGHLIRLSGPLAGLVWSGGSKVAAVALERLAMRVNAPEFGPAYKAKGHPAAGRTIGWEAWTLAAAASCAPQHNTVILHTLLGINRALEHVQMPNGLTHRAAPAGSGPWGAFLNPNPWASGDVPDDTSVARTFMASIAIYGWAAARKALGMPRVPRLDDALMAMTSLVPARGHIIVGQTLGEPFKQGSMSTTDSSSCSWELVWTVAWAVREEQDRMDRAALLRTAIHIAGMTGGYLPTSYPGWEYQRSGTARAWWDRTPELVALAQAGVGTEMRD